MSIGSAISALAGEGGLGAVLWAGPETGTNGSPPAQGTRRKGPVALRLGFSGDDLGYAVDLGPPTPMDIGDGSLFVRDPVIKREWIFAGEFPRLATLRRPGRRVADDHRARSQRPVRRRDSCGLPGIAARAASVRIFVHPCVRKRGHLRRTEALRNRCGPNHAGSVDCRAGHRGCDRRCTGG